MIRVAVVGPEEAVTEADLVVAAVVLVVADEDVQVLVERDVVDVSQAGREDVQVASVRPAAEDAAALDNENDGGDYKIRVCHSFFGADHGYPYLYYERPDEALPPLADLGLGSSAGGVCYLETQFPPEYRGNLFFCEWGRAVVRYRPARAGSGFGPLKEIEFASGAANDPYGF